MVQELCHDEPAEDEAAIRHTTDENLFEVLAEHAEKEYRAGRTLSLRDFADENDTPL